MKKIKKFKLIFILLLATFIIFMYFDSSILHKSTSPNNENIIIFKDKGSFLLGDSTLIISAKKNTINSFISSSKFKINISNDGKNLTSNNLSISWLGNNIAIVTIISDVNLEKKIKILFDTNITYELL